MVLTRIVFRQYIFPTEPTMSKKTIILAQLFITFSMALSMSGIMGFIALGAEFLARWPQSFIIAWPIAFVVSQIITPLSFKLAHRMTVSIRPA
jgi:hypothetical protein